MFLFNNSKEKQLIFCKRAQEHKSMLWLKLIGISIQQVNKLKCTTDADKYQALPDMKGQRITDITLFLSVFANIFHLHLLFSTWVSWDLGHAEGNILLTTWMCGEKTFHPVKFWNVLLYNSETTEIWFPFTCTVFPKRSWHNNDNDNNDNNEHYMFLSLGPQSYVPFWLQNTQLYHWPRDRDDILRRLMRVEKYNPPPVGLLPTIFSMPIWLPGINSAQ